MLLVKKLVLVDPINRRLSCRNTDELCMRNSVFLMLECDENGVPLDNEDNDKIIDEAFAIQKKINA
jgi:hypothetical protein